MPWDHLAGTLIVSEAGGYVRLLDGRPYTPADTTTDLLLATDVDSWHLLQREVFAL